MVIEYVIKAPTDIKTVLSEKGFSKNLISALLSEKKDVYINGERYATDYRLNKGDRLKIEISDKPSTILPVQKEIDIVYEDDLFLVVNKEKGLITIPSKRHFNDSLSGRVANYYQRKGICAGIHILNRLDKETCGLVVFAKNGYIHYIVSQQKIIKEYRCTATGIFENKRGVINANIKRENANSIKRVVSEGGQSAITEYRVENESNGNSTLILSLKTGRTHQIRVHLSYIGHPLIGDALYNENAKDYSAFDLCACHLSFYCPINDKNYSFKI